MLTISFLDETQHERIFWRFEYKLNDFIKKKMFFEQPITAPFFRDIAHILGVHTLHCRPQDRLTLNPEQSNRNVGNILMSDFSTHSYIIVCADY